MEAFEALYDRYGNIVYSVTLRILGDVHAAEDVVQEVFLRVWRRPDHYDTARGRFLTWLLSVARNRAIDEQRSRGRRQRFEVGSAPLDGEGPQGDEADDPALAALLADERSAVRRALVGLPPEQRSAIELAYYGGFTQQEIARALGEPLGTVKTRIRLGMQKMRAALADLRSRYEGEDELRGSSGTAGRL
jgi:RNA polymerase sigma-70 factor (ECF subfamily)